MKRKDSALLKESRTRAAFPRLGLNPVTSTGRQSVMAAVLMFLAALGSPFSFGQWLTQSFPLTNGWNAVFSHVDASHTTLDAAVGSDGNNPILEVWRWNPSSSIQFADSIQDPVDTGSQWIKWERSEAGSSLQRVVGNSAYLVHVSTNVVSYVWSIQGRPVAPANDWTTTGLNFIGFPTVPNNPPNFETFLAQAPQLQQNAEIFSYPGGNLGANNPARVLAFRNTPVRRGQAYWIRAGTEFNRYFGPFELNLPDGSGVDFKNNLNSSTLLLKNLTAANLTVTLTLIPSETPPAGQPSILGVPPLLIRGSINLTNLTYGYTNLPANSARSWALAPQGQPGSEVEVVLGLNRTAITNSAGSFFAGTLRFTDSLGFSQVDAPVSATAGSTAGLWLGRALVTQVGQYLKTYQLDSTNKLVISTNGNYIATSTNTSLGAVARPFPLRLIVHNPDSGSSSNAVLLQRVFFGLDANTNFIVANKESALNRNLLNQARRISATHLPFSPANAPWTFNGQFPSGSLTTTVTLDYKDQASNPFLHTYHPDHDNIDATFKNVLPQGSESYSVRRAITLGIQPPGADFSSLISGVQTIAGTYQETITVLGLPRAGNTQDTREFRVQGVFSLNRILNVQTLTVVP